MTVAPSGRQFAITAGPHQAGLVEVGGGIRTYTYRGDDVLDGFSVLQRCSGARGAPLIPWPNRLADGAYTFAGTDYQVPLTEPETHNAIHGLLRWRNWEIRDGDGNGEGDRIVLGTVLHPMPGYPFTLDVAIDYTLRELAHPDAGPAPGPAGLTVATTATNLGDEPCPYACGQHPYLTVGTAFIDDAVLTLAAETWLPTDQRGLPVGRRPVDGSPYDFRRGRGSGPPSSTTPSPTSPAPATGGPGRSYRAPTGAAPGSGSTSTTPTSSSTPATPKPPSGGAAASAWNP